MLLPEPDDAPADTVERLLTYLAFSRSEVRRKLDGLGTEALRASRLPSGWTPLELLAHLVHMERRWIVWGFLGEPVPDPWGDHASGDPDAGWSTDASVEDLLDRLDHGAARTETVLRTRPLDATASLGGRFTASPPTLHAIAFHVLQEYVRHLGHLDVARELVDGSVGEAPSA